MQNVWGAGQDALLGFLADRDAKRRLEEDRSRRDQLDAESFADRQRAREIQEGQLRSVDEDRRERRAAAESAARLKAQQEQQITEALNVFANTDAHPPEAVRRAAAVLDRHKVDPRALKSLNPQTEMQPIMRVNPRTGKVEQIGEAPKGARVVMEPAPPAPEKPLASERDDPSLPRGTKAWIESLAQRGISLTEARNELSQGWARQRAAHPRAELVAASDYLTKLYPTDPESADIPRVALGSAQPSVAPPAGAVDPQQAAIKFLTDNGAPVTPANIAAVMQRMGGGQ